jgi:hypothetical protein
MPADQRPHNDGATMTKTPRAAPRWVLPAAGAAAWALLVGVGMVALVRYSLGPGRSAEAPAVWPATSRLARAAGRPTLVMVAHPRCACTRASLGELAVLMTRCQGRVAATVLFVWPPGTSTAWNETDLRRSAAAIPGVAVLTDEGGREAHRFGAATSGQVLLYDAAGRLRFSGGITGGRGHSGDNAGREALQALLVEGQARRSSTPVFGCELFNPHSAAARESTQECRE